MDIQLYDLPDLADYGQDFLLTWNQPKKYIEVTIQVAEMFRELHRRGDSLRHFNTGLAVSIFRDQSTRTRYSFTAAANALGLGVMDLDEEKSQIAHGETVRETANMLSFLTKVIGIRDDMYLGMGNRYMQEVSGALDLGFEEGTLPFRPGLVNLQCDIDHPTQSMSDLAWLKQYFGSLDNLRGKKVAMTWAYSPSYGKPLSVPQGIIGLLTRFGMDVSLAHPEGYDLLPEVVEIARTNAVEAGSFFEVTHSMEAAFEDADVVYPKSWAPFAVMEQRTELLQSGDKAELKKLEQEGLAINSSYTDWECNDRMMDITHNGSALYMHCLPADITGVSCEQGEVSRTVFDKFRQVTYQEASFKPYIIAAMMFLMTVENPAAELIKMNPNI